MPTVNMQDLATRLRHSSSNPSAVETIASELQEAANPSPSPPPPAPVIATPEATRPADAKVEDRVLKIKAKTAPMAARKTVKKSKR